MSEDLTKDQLFQLNSNFIQDQLNFKTNEILNNKCCFWEDFEKEPLAIVNVPDSFTVGSLVELYQSKPLKIFLQDNRLFETQLEEITDPLDKTIYSKNLPKKRKLDSCLHMTSIKFTKNE